MQRGVERLEEVGLRHRRGALAEFEVDGAEVVVAFGEVGAQGDGALVGVERPVVVAGVVVGVAELVQSLVRVGAEL